MPASRSRTHEWKRLLQQIAERGGAIEIAVAHPDHDANEPDAHAAGPDLVWRVKILDLGEDEIVVESPMALGRDIHIEEGKQPRRCAKLMVSIARNPVGLQCLPK